MSACKQIFVSNVLKSSIFQVIRIQRVGEALKRVGQDGPPLQHLATQESISASAVICKYPLMIDTY